MAYATAADLARLALPARALTGILLADQDAALDAASALADGYLAARYTLPLLAWGDDLRRTVSLIAAYDLMTRRGYSPEGGDEQLRLRYEDGMKWLEQVSKGTINPTGFEESPPSATPAPGDSGPVIAERPLRGW